MCRDVLNLLGTTLRVKLDQIIFRFLGLNINDLILIGSKNLSVIHLYFIHKLVHNIISIETKMRMMV